MKWKDFYPNNIGTVSTINIEIFRYDIEHRVNESGISEYAPEYYNGELGGWTVLGRYRNIKEAKEAAKRHLIETCITGLKMALGE